MTVVGSFQNHRNWPVLALFVVGAWSFRVGSYNHVFMSPGASEWTGSLGSFLRQRRKIHRSETKEPGGHAKLPQLSTCQSAFSLLHT